MSGTMRIPKLGKDWQTTRTNWYTAMGMAPLETPALDFLNFSKAESHMWPTIHDLMKADPDKFQQWYALYRLGVRHG